MLQAPAVSPAPSYEIALERVRRMQALDGGNILPQAHTTLLDTGARSFLAVVLLHGFTNHPGQYREFAPLLHARGVNVLIPRMPEHGERDRLTPHLARLTADMLLERASQAVDIACGLGERVCVSGISSSGLLAAYFAQYRRDVARSVPVAPEFGILTLPHVASDLLAGIFLVMPNLFLWWDPRAKYAMHPLTAYPRFSTRALAQTLRIGHDVYKASGRTAFAAGSVQIVVNPADPAVNNAVARKVVERWQRKRPEASYREIPGLPRNHDIIEPDNPKARTELVYPVLFEAILEEPHS